MQKLILIIEGHKLRYSYTQQGSSNKVSQLNYSIMIRVKVVHVLVVVAQVVGEVVLALAVAIVVVVAGK